MHRSSTRRRYQSTRRKKEGPSTGAPISFQFLKLSYDAQVMTFEMLAPADLLSLCRTNKSLRKTLTDPNHLLVWRRARENVDGLPPCPEWLTEARYAALCFDKHCQRCLQVDRCSANPIWQFYSRYCLQCKISRTTTANPFRDLPRGAYLSIFSPSPQTLFPTYYGAIIQNENIVKDWIYHLVDIERVRSTILQASESAAIDPASTLDGAVVPLLRAQQVHTLKRMSHARKCREWKIESERREREAAEKTMAMRRSDILHRMQDMGFSAEVSRLGPNYEALSGRCSMLVNQPRLLTEREWPKLLPDLLKFFRHRRVLEVRLRLVRAMFSRLNSLETALNEFRLSEEQYRNKVFPSPTDLCDLEAVQHLIKLPSEVYFPPAAFRKLVPEFVKLWKERREKVLLALLPSITPVADTEKRASSLSMVTRSAVKPPPPLSLPTALFWCSACKSIITGTFAMRHACCYNLCSGSWQNILDTVADDGQYPAVVLNGDTLFQETCLVYSRGLCLWTRDPLRGCAGVARAVLSACGANPQPFARKATSAASSARVACGKCSQPGIKLLVMAWMTAVHHAFEVHDGADAQWFRVCARVEEKVKLAEETSTRLTLRKLRARTRWNCLQCAWPHSTVSYYWPELCHHFSIMHPTAAAMDPWQWSESSDSPAYTNPVVRLYDAETRSSNAPILENHAGEPKVWVELIANMKFPKDAFA